MVQPEVALARRYGVSRDRLEKEGLAFHKNVVDGYLALAQQYPERLHLIDGEDDMERVADLIWTRVKAALVKKGLLAG
jgi:dTMP kinase